MAIKNQQQTELTPRQRAESKLKEAVLHVMGVMNDYEAPLDESKKLAEAFGTDDLDELEIMMHLEILLHVMIDDIEYEVLAKTIGEKLDYLERIVIEQEKKPNINNL